VQTFLPYPDPVASARALDDRRLGKQRVETLQILRALHLEDYGWANHPAVTMWRGHTLALVAYGLAVVDAWVARGYADTTREPIAEFALPHARLGGPGDLDPALLPPWWGTEAVHRSHRAALVRKEPARYGHLAVAAPDEPYCWPQPPAPSPPPLPFSAWLVRAAGAEDRAAQVRRGVAGAPASLRADGARPKQRRQLGLFLDEIAPGDPVALTDGDVLELGEVVGLAVPDGEGLTRRVRYTGRVRRADLLRPWQLQDPRVVSRLRGEPTAPWLVR
jgi:hypothetical protein